MLANGLAAFGNGHLHVTQVMYGDSLASPGTITAFEPATVGIPVDIIQRDRDNGQVANAHELAAERPDAPVHVVEGADQSFSGGVHENETIETTLELYALLVGER